MMIKMSSYTESVRDYIDSNILINHKLTASATNPLSWKYTVKLSLFIITYFYTYIKFQHQQYRYGIFDNFKDAPNSIFGT